MKRLLTGSTPVVGSSNSISCGTAIWAKKKTCKFDLVFYLIEFGLKRKTWFSPLSNEVLWMKVNFMTFFLPLQWRCWAFVWFHRNSTWFWRVYIAPNPCASTISPPHDEYDGEACLGSMPYTWESHKPSCTNSMHPLAGSSQTMFCTVIQEKCFSFQILDADLLVSVIVDNPKDKMALHLYTHQGWLIEAAHAINVNLAVSHSCVVCQHFECGCLAGSIDSKQTEAFTWNGNRRKLISWECYCNI